MKTIMSGNSISFEGTTNYNCIIIGNLINGKPDIFILPKKSINRNQEKHFIKLIGGVK